MARRVTVVAIVTFATGSMHIDIELAVPERECPHSRLRQKAYDRKGVSVGRDSRDAVGRDSRDAICLHRTGYLDGCIYSVLEGVLSGLV